MYLAYFGLREPPFGITPDTSFIYSCRGHQEALNTLLVCAKNGEGFIKIVGEVGTGKTLLCRKFLASVDPSFVTAYVPNPYLKPRALFLALADEIGVNLQTGQEQHHLLKNLALALLNFARERKRVVLCLDEAQAMPYESMEALRLLTNLETEKRKLLQVMLFGQPELDQKLAQDSVRQLRQRISFQYCLQGLEKNEIDDYLSHRLRVAGYRGNRLFSRPAVAKLHRASHGIPRLVNILAHKTLLLAYGSGSPQVSVAHVEGAILDTPQAKRGIAPFRWLGFA